MASSTCKQEALAAWHEALAAWGKRKDETFMPEVGVAGSNVTKSAIMNGKKEKRGFFGLGRKSKADKPQYEGAMRDGKACGQGFCTWPNGDTYDGEWKDNRMHGHGEFVWQQKSCRYLGQYKDGLSHGKGKLILDGEGQYDGEFFEGKKHGRGVWTGPDDILYDGQYQNDRRHGFGTLNMQDGSSYAGEWREGKFDGHGTWTWRDGRCFKGLFSKDHPVEGILNHEGASRNVTWDMRTGTFVAAEQAGLLDPFSPRRWSGGQKDRSLAADAATPPAASSAGLWGICGSSRKSGLDTARSSAKSERSFDNDEMPPLPVKETWCPPANTLGTTFADHRRRFCAWFP